MTLAVLAGVALLFAAGPAVLYARNVRLFRQPPAVPSDSELSPPAVSVLIPARNEEASVAAAVESVLASRGVAVEVVVLDDHSDDRTAAVVGEMAAKDARVRLERAPPLPSGWCGKQHACMVLSRQARHDLLVFLDADVRLAPDALARMVAFLGRSGADLVSGFPHQETGTALERLVLPLIHFLLLGYLPFDLMRRTRLPGSGAGCGQWFVTRRNAYERVGGHAAVKASMHDGLTLPRAYRQAGMRTDVCDATDVARCRMYRSARQVWFGLAKNAREGLAAPRLLLPTTAMLFAGHVLPVVLLAALPWMCGPATAATVAAVVASYYPRLEAAWRFRQSWCGAVLHPVGVATLLGIQWFATVRAWVGSPVGWKGRTVNPMR